MRAWWIAVVWVMWSVVARAQEPTPAVAQLLAKLYAYAQEYRARVPSLECDEDVISQLVVKGKVRKQDRITGVLRNVRVPDAAEPYQETHIFRTLNGVQLPEVHRFKIPYFAQSGFANAIGFADPEREACYVYELVPLSEHRAQLSMALREGGQPAVYNEIGKGYHKTVIVDPGTGEIFRVQVEMQDRAADRLKEPSFGLVIYEAKPIGDEELLLPVKFEASSAKGERRMTATYSNFHRYTATVSIEGMQVGTEPQ